MRLSDKKIESKLGILYQDLPIILYKTTDSTNTRAKEQADSGFVKNAVFIASGQTAGRGRLGRSFISEGEKGLYLSILLDKESAKASGLSITTYMATVACRVIERLAPVNVAIKWVNDIYANGKKLAGILTEGRINPTDSTLDYAVCGIGINLYKQEFDVDVKDIATTIEDAAGIRVDINELAAELITEFFEGLSTVGSKEIATEYKNRSFLIGKKVKVIKADREYDAEVIDITDSCELLIKTEDESTETLFTGEVSLKIK